MVALEVSATKYPGSALRPAAPALAATARWCGRRPAGRPTWWRWRTGPRRPAWQARIPRPMARWACRRGWAGEDHALLGQHEVEGGQVSDDLGVERPSVVVVEILQRLAGWEPSLPDAASPP